MSLSHCFYTHNITYKKESDGVGGGGGGWGGDEVEWTGQADIRKISFLAAGEACKAIINLTYTV